MKDQVCQHLRSLGIKPKDSARWGSIIDKMIVDNGKEFTVSRLKNLTEALKNNVKQGGYSIPDLFATRVNSRGDKIVKDGLIHRLLSAKTQNEIFIAQSVFKVHTLIVIDEKIDGKVYPTKKQLKKYLTAVKEPISTPDLDAFNKINVNMHHQGVKMGESFKLKGFTVNSDLVPLRYLPKSHKTSPVLQFNQISDTEVQFKLKPNVPRDDISTKGLGILYYDRQWHKLVTKYHRESSECIFGSGSYTAIFKKKDRIYIDNLPIGICNWIQEPSCKLRAVMSPDYVLQALSEPLKRKTKALIESFSQCHTSDHDAGRILVQNWLEQDKIVYAYDASNFTERLPLETQLSVLEGLIQTGFISQFDYDVFKLASQGEYKDVLHDRTLKYEVGQPQGLGPSFNVATLTHVAIVMSCITSRDQSHLFSVIGDDIVIADKELADSYINKMSTLGVDINQEKSLISDVVSEYAGKMITKEGIILSAKIKRIHEGEDTNKVTSKLLAHMSFYGNVDAWKNFSPAQRYYAYKAIEPLYMGGLDFKMPGDSAELKFSRINWERVRRSYIKSDLTSYISPYSHTNINEHLEWINSFDKLIDSTFNQQLTYTQFRRYLGTTQVEHASSGIPLFLQRAQDETLFKGVKHHNYFGTYDENNKPKKLAGYKDVVNTMQSTALSIFNMKVEGTDTYSDHGETYDKNKVFPSLTPINRILIEAGVSKDFITQFFDKDTGYISTNGASILKSVSSIIDLIPEVVKKDVHAISAKGIPNELRNKKHTVNSNKGESGYTQPKTRPGGSFYPR